MNSNVSSAEQKEGEAVEQATAEFISEEYPNMSDNMAHLWARAIAADEKKVSEINEDLKYLQARNPGLSNKDARIWAEARLDHFSVNLEDAKLLNRPIHDKPNIPELLKQRVEKARDEFFELTERETVNPSETPEQLTAKDDEEFDGQGVS